MSVLDRINVDVLRVPGLAFWRGQRPSGPRIVAQNANGAIELWDLAVEVHSPVPLDAGDGPGQCEVLAAPCYYEGGSLAECNRALLRLVEAGDSPAVLRHLAELHQRKFGAVR